jgi:hypothetical protein
MHENNAVYPLYLLPGGQEVAGDGSKPGQDGSEKDRESWCQSWSGFHWVIPFRSKYPFC